MAKKPPVAVRVLAPAEYPETITRDQGAFRPRIEFAAMHPLGLFFVENQGAGYRLAQLLPHRKGARRKVIGGASSLAGALRRIKDYEDEALEPDAPREEGKNGPVSIWSLGKRTSGTKTPTELDREIDAIIARGED